MPSQRTPLITGELYHVSDRAVGDSVIFKDESDYYRGIFSCYEFNNENPVIIRERRQQRKREKDIEKGLIKTYRGPTPVNSGIIAPGRNRFVDILAFCFMPNHIHLLLRQLIDGGISQFMKKIGGYSTYFNGKYGRKGHLFNRFKAVHIKDNNQLRMGFIYVHINPLSLIEPGWKENGIKDPERAIKFLEEEYRWSSNFDYLGKNNFPSVTQRDFLLNELGGEEGCRQAVRNWVKYKKRINFEGVDIE